MSKLLERIVSDKLSPFLAPKLNLHQFGFRSGHTTFDLSSLMAQSWTDALKEGDEARAVALDISKAFDRVWHAGLLHKLHALGVHGPLLDWIRSFLSNRSQRVSVGSAYSSSRPIGAGVPQGSVLAPLLFLVFINDLFDVVTNSLNVFADDSTLWSIVRASATLTLAAARASVAASMSKDLLAIARWADRWLVTFNAGKTEALIISKKHDMTEYRKNPLDKDGKFLNAPAPCPHPALNFDGLVLPESPSFKVVGLTYVGNLSWDTHIRNVARKGRRALGLLSRARAFLSKQALATLYKSHVRSTLEYCCPIWMGSGSEALFLLDRIQARAAALLGHHARDLQSL